MGLGDFITGIFGSKNKATAKANLPQVDPNAFEYGGVHNGANIAAQRYRDLGAGAQGRQGVQLATGQADAARQQQQDARAQAQGARDAQVASLGLQQRAAQGLEPSVAAIQQRQGVDAAVRSQQALAAGARGQAALAGAQYGAAQNTAAIQQGAVSEAAKLRAAEMAQARGEFAAGAGALRGADQANRAQDMALRGQDLQQATAQAQLAEQQRARNDAFQLGMTGYEFGVNQAQLNAQMQGQQIAQQGALGASAIDQRTSEANAGRNQQNAMFLIGTGAGALGQVASDERNKDVVGDAGGDAPVTWGDGSNKAPRVGPIEAYYDKPAAGLQGMVLDFAKPAYGASMGEPDAKLAKGMAARAPGYGPGAAVTVPGPSVKEQQAALRQILHEDSGPRDETAYGQGSHAGKALFGAGAGLFGMGKKPAGPGSGGDGGGAYGQVAGVGDPGENAAVSPGRVDWKKLSMEGAHGHQRGGGAATHVVSDANSKRIIADLAKKNDQLSSQLSRYKVDVPGSDREEFAPSVADQAASEAKRAKFDRELNEDLHQQVVKRLAADKSRIAAAEAERDEIPSALRKAYRFATTGGAGGMIGRSAVAAAPVVMQAATLPPPQQMAAQAAPPVPPEARSDEKNKRVYSDKDAKSDAAKGAPVSKFLDSLNSWAYRYKPGIGEDTDRMRFGPMAQEVEKTPVGASFVEETPKGKVLDIQHGFPVALGALGNLNDRVRALETKKKGGR
jgi:hypothetical protein